MGSQSSKLLGSSQTHQTQLVAGEDFPGGWLIQPLEMPLVRGRPRLPMNQRPDANHVGLLELPPEIRRRIYKLVLPEDTDVRTTIHPPLTLTCRFLRDEALPYWLSVNELELPVQHIGCNSSHSVAARSAENWLATVPKALLAHIGGVFSSMTVSGYPPQKKIIVEYIINMDNERLYLAVKSNWLLSPASQALIHDRILELMEIRHPMTRPRPRNGNLLILLAKRLQGHDLYQQIQHGRHSLCTGDAAVVHVLEISYSRAVIDGDIDEVFWEASETARNPRVGREQKEGKLEEPRQLPATPMEAEQRLDRKPRLYGPDLSKSGIPYVRQSLLTAEKEEREKLERFLRRGPDDQGPWW